MEEIINPKGEVLIKYSNTKSSVLKYKLCFMEYAGSIYIFITFIIGNWRKECLRGVHGKDRG